MADTGLRYALQPFATGTQVVAKGEVRLSTDAAVTGSSASFWATIDTADPTSRKASTHGTRIRG